MFYIDTITGSSFLVIIYLQHPFYPTAAHAEPSWPVTPRANLTLPQMHGTRKEVLAAHSLKIVQSSYYKDPGEYTKGGPPRLPTSKFSDYAIRLHVFSGGVII